MIRLISTAVFAVGAVLVGAAPAGAEEASPPGGLTIFGWYLSNGRVGLGFEPDYIGSNDYRFAPSGSISFARKGDATGGWGAPDDGFSVGLVGDRTLSAGLVGRWRSGRDDKGDLRGIDKIDGTIEAGGFLNSWPADWLRLRGEVRHGLGGHDSWTADVGADAVARTGAWTISIGPRLAWADEDFTRTYFDVTVADAARSPFAIPAFATKGDFWSPGLLASAEYRVNRSWSVTATGGYHRLTGDAADSPLVADLGSRDQFNAGLSLTYTFAP